MDTDYYGCWPTDNNPVRWIGHSSLNVTYHNYEFPGTEYAMHTIVPKVVSFWNGIENMITLYANGKSSIEYMSPSSYAEWKIRVFVVDEANVEAINAQYDNIDEIDWAEAENLAGYSEIWPEDTSQDDRINSTVITLNNATDTRLEGTCSGSGWPAEAVLSHEIGHVVGLGHTYSGGEACWSIMGDGAEGGTCAIECIGSPGVAEQAGIECLYGEGFEAKPVSPVLGTWIASTLTVECRYPVNADVILVATNGKNERVLGVVSAESLTVGQTSDFEVGSLDDEKWLVEIRHGETGHPVAEPVGRLR